MKKISLALLMATMTSYASAQVVQSVSMRSQGSAASVSNTIVTTSFSNTSLGDVLNELSRISGSVITYSPEIVPVRRRVTYQASNARLGDVLAVILKGTGVVPYISQSGKITLVAANASQGQGIITGKVTDAKSGKGIPKVSISIASDNRAVLTDEDGSYRLAGIASGTHTLVARLVGYAKQTRAVTVGSGATVTADFKLEVSASVLNEVVVTGTIIATELKAVPNAITVITAKEIEERGITRIDQLFRGDIPGLFALNLGSGPSGLLDEVVMFSRGATALVSGSTGSGGINNSVGALTNTIKTYVDGVEMADSRYLSQIDPTSIERIEILTGPQASTIYGANAINGVMQIFTKRGSGSKPQFTLNFSSGVAQNNFNNHLATNYVTDAAVSAADGRVSYNLSASWNYAGAWVSAKQTQRLSGNGGVRIQWSRANMDVSARRGMTQNRQKSTTEQNILDLRATGVWNPRGLGMPSPTTQTLFGSTVGLSLGFRPSQWWSHDFTIGSDVSTTQTLANEPVFFSPTDTNLSYNPATSARLSQRYTSGLQIPMSSVFNLNLTIGGDRFQSSGSSWTTQPLNIIGTLGNPAATRTRPSKNSGAFIQGNFGIFDALFLTYGIRADWNPSFGEKAKVTPGKYGVSFNHDLGPVSLKLRGTYGRSIRPPNDGQKLGVLVISQTLVSQFGSFYSRLPNPDLQPEHQQGGEGGIEMYFGARASLVITRYNQTVDNLISLVGSTSASSGPGLDSVRSLAVAPSNGANCHSDFRDDDGHCFRYQQQYLNVGGIRNQGWELNGNMNLGPFTTRGTYSWTKSRVAGVTEKYRGLLSGTAFTPGRPFNFVPEHTWALGITYTQSSSSLGLAFNGIGMRYVSFDALGLAANGNNRFTTNIPRSVLTGYRPQGSGYVIVDLNGSHRFSSSLDATLHVTNLGDHYANDSDIQYGTVGRQSRVGIRWRFQ